MSASDLAELSTLGAQVDDLVTRVVVIAQRYDDSSDAAVAAACFAAERGLLAARRSLAQAASLFEERPSP
jgi:hypothetical protein